MENKLIQVQIDWTIYSLYFKHAKKLCGLKDKDTKIKYARKHSIFKSD